MLQYSKQISGGPCLISVSSIKDRLRNQSKKDGTTFQDKLLTYGLERTLYRISTSPYNSKFTLKGGSFLYYAFGGKYARTTVDMDLLAQNTKNDEEEIGGIFKRIFEMQSDDGLFYDIKTLKVRRITEFKEYHGVKVTINAYLDKTLIPISIDIGFGDVIYPDRKEIVFPVLLNNEIPHIYAYSIYSTIAEKYEAIVSLGLANSRYKDFYDIYILARNFNINGEDLKIAIKKTFENRKTGFNDIAAFNDEFINDEINIKRWDSFVKKKRAIIKISLKETINLLKIFLLPVNESIINETSFNYYWNSKVTKWQNSEISE